MVCRVIVGRLVINTLKNSCFADLNLKHSQGGVALIVFVFFIALAASSFLMHSFNAVQLKNNQNKVTLQALSEAKQALLAYAIDDITVAARNPSLLRCDDKNSDGIIDNNDAPYSPKYCNCGNNCPRPGYLPCVDKVNKGEASTACSLQGDRLGRLPWKTLGTDDLRDGTGERLWYAVSNQYKNNPHLVLNSQTVGGISVRNVDGNLVNDASLGNGVVAVIIAVQAPITRYELDGSKTVQTRSAANLNVPIHYLDIAENEDNSNLQELTQNGFISGVYKLMLNNQPVIISNDIILPIYQSEVTNLSKMIVLEEVTKALKNDVDVLPAPSSKNDPTCIGNTSINGSVCNADTTSIDGYIPVGQGDDSLFAGWQIKNINSILRGEATNNWFQQNGWRNQVKYQKNAPCNSEKWCKDIDAQTTIRID